MTTVSVIVPVYNGENYIDGCMECLNSQILNNLEIIFVDDGSYDDSLEKLKKYENDNITVLTQNNAGAGAARNTGIRKAKGEYVAFLDVDDKFANRDTLSILYEKAKEHHALICGGSLGKVEGKFSVGDKRIFMTEGFVNYAEYQFDFGFTRFIYNREMLVGNHIYFPTYRIYEDPVFMVNAMIAANRFYVIPDQVYIYSGVHQKDLNEERTVDYLHGLRDNLIISSKYNYAHLHRENFERLKTTGSYYAEINMISSNDLLFGAMIDANASIDRELLETVGINLSEGYIIPALRTVWKASGNYAKLRSFFSVRKFLNQIREK